jgi:hypothetical protein
MKIQRESFEKGYARSQKDVTSCIWWTVITLCVVTSLALGQGFSPSSNGAHPLPPHDPKMPPSTSLLDAYASVLARISVATNRFHCVSATCLERTAFGLPGWSFTFSNTNGETARVEYDFKAKVAYIPDAKSVALLK